MILYLFGTGEALQKYLNGQTLIPSKGTVTATKEDFIIRTENEVVHGRVVRDMFDLNNLRGLRAGAVLLDETFLKRANQEMHDFLRIHVTR